MYVYKDTYVDNCIVRRIKEPTRDYTESLARKYGWEFNVYLSDDRLGCGYCFSGEHCDVETATKEYMKYNGHREFLSVFRHIKWKPGRLVEGWKDNVVAIGLSSGFVDPLEANGLIIVVHEIRTLAKCLQRGTGQAAYNRSINKAWDQTVDLVWHHYALSQRDDTEFWRQYTHIDATNSLWKNYEATRDVRTSIYSSSVWATMALYYDKIK